MNQQEEIERLRAENHELREELAQVKEMLRLALARIEELERQHEPPEFVKENVKKSPTAEKKARKKRDPSFNHGRPRALPTRDAWSTAS